MPEPIEIIRAQAQKIARSGALGRSRSYVRLLEYFVDCWVKGRVPKEIEIAMEVFARGPDFDPSQDSMVRVYVHNLRQKLDHYYSSAGAREPQQLTLARGEYRIALAAVPGVASEAATIAPPVSVRAQDEPADEPPATRNPLIWQMRAAAALGLVVLGVALGMAVGEPGGPERTEAHEVAASAIWSPLLADDLPVTVVVGEYYIFGEMDRNGNIERLIREFSVNSSKDLDELIMHNPGLLGRYIDLDLTYLPRGAAFALRDVLRVLNTSTKPVRIVSALDFNVADMKTSHIVYLGYVSGLDTFEDFVFASSSLAVGATYDELTDTATGTVYSSEAGVAGDRSYRDYGLISTFPGPGGNQFLIVAGTRDAGMMQAAHVLADPMFLRSLEAARPDPVGLQPPSFEALYEVMGYAGTSLDAMLVHAAPLDYERIWGGHFLHAKAAE